MPSSHLFSETISVLEKTLNYRSRRHEVLASNIANIDTPNFKAFDLVMAEELSKPAGSARQIDLVRTHAEHLPMQARAEENLELKQADPSPFTLRGDGNTVDIEKSMGDLAENTLLFKTVAQMIARKFEGLKNVIRGGN